MSSRATHLALLVTLIVAGAPRPAAAQGPRRAPAISDAAAKLYADKPVIELVTMGIGALIWERHGHIALCIREADPRRDRCFNYGIGDFQHPFSMGWGFFRGTHSFWVGELDPGLMFSIYRNADRTIWVQPLPLTAAQKQKVIARLEHDILEENRHYAYDHFWDNCTTRVRDVINDATDGALAAMTGPPDDRTYRDLARKGFLGMRPALLITDLAMGRATDRVPSYYERMFLPDYVRIAVADHWGIEPIVRYQRVGPPPLDDGPSGRVWLALIILLLTAPAWASRLLHRFQRTGLAVAVVPPVLLGLIFWGLAVISPLPYVRWNESCLIFFPLDVALLVLPWQWRRLYARGRVIMLALVAALLAIDVLHQPIAAALLWPLVPALVVGFWPAPTATRAAGLGS